MKIKSVLVVCFLLVAVFSCTVMGYLFGFSIAEKDNISHNKVQSGQAVASVRTKTSATQSLQEQTEPSEIIEKKPQATYILRENNGKISLFIKNSDGNENLHSSYDVPIVFLPKSDRDMLSKGIEFDSREEIMQFIEDYIG